MSIATSTTNKSSPKLCLLLKTLLVLLCIYIKRVTAVAATNSISFPDIDLGATVNRTLSYDERFVSEGEIDFDLICPSEDLVQLKQAYNNSNYLDKLKKEIINEVDIIWLKDNERLHRENGNPLLEQIGTDEKVLTLLGAGQSDEGLYTCLLNYTNVPEEAYDYFDLYRSASFQLKLLPSQNNLPDMKPMISHQPLNQFVHRGADVEFTCNRMVTLSAQETYWFKSCSPMLFNTTKTNKTCVDKFLKDYNRTVEEGERGYMQKYIIADEHGDELKLYNVSEKDIGHYGCLVQNARGIDIRIAELNLLDVFFKSQFPNSSIQSNATTTIIDEPMRSKSQYDLSSTNGSTILSQSLSTSPPTPPTITPEPVTTPAHATTPLTPVYYSATLGGVQFPDGRVAAVHDDTNFRWSYLFSAMFGAVVLIILIVIWKFLRLSIGKGKKPDQNLITPTSIVVNNHQEVNLRQHLPNGECPDIYNIGKTADGFISGHLHQSSGHLMSQSICSQMLEKEKNPSISSTSNSSDEASSWGKSVSSHGDNSRAFYTHTSDTTTTTVPMYDHPPSTGKTQLCGAIVQDACVINPTYGFLRLDSDESDDWVFPRRNLERLNKIGEGQFGEVWRYEARQKDGNKSFVAVKQLKNRAGLGDTERLELIAEIEIMKSVNNHPNVIKLLNYCADDFEPILLIMEYAENGKLQTYLRDCRSFRKSYGCLNDFNSIKPKDLITFSYHIAKGMEYVASQGIVHRDLASRNILVSKDKVCKVADFGFARRVTDECAYERTTANPVPVRWMAPEALVENKFTSKSDVFSLGILMWEIVTLGATPYECLKSSEVYNRVTSGGRLERPAHCKDEFYNIMKKCWEHDPAERPTFKQLACQLEQLLKSETDYIELDEYPEHAYYNIMNAEEREIVHIDTKVDAF